MGKKGNIEPKRNLKVHSVAFDMLQNIEEKFPVDSIKLSDGTRIWNLLRIIIFYYFQKQENVQIEETVTFSSKSSKLPRVNIKNFLPMKYPNNIDFCGFSGTESRKLWRNTYYDIYLDPLYEVLGNRFAVFEWPNEQGHRRRYDSEIYSKTYVPMHIPISTKTFWNIVMYKLFRKRHFKMDSGSNGIVDNIVDIIADSYSVNGRELRKHLDDAVEIFVCMNNLLRNLLEKVKPKAVFIRCGYGRFHMALSQACKELNIPSIELQHGFINKHTPGYVKAMKSGNRDCVPEYFLSYGEKFTEIVKKGNLFDPEKVVSIGYPYLENVKECKGQFNENTEEFKSNYNKYILITSDSLPHIASEVEQFTMDLSKVLSLKNKKIGIIFKPHPFDKNDYKHLQEIENIYVADRYAITYNLLKNSDIHSTVFSTSAIEALAFGVPNILINIKGGYAENIRDIIDKESSFLVDTVNEYIHKLNLILSNYDNYSHNALQKSKHTFKPNANENLRKFIKNLEMRS